MLLDLVRDQSPLGRERLHYFLINKGPWSRLDHNQVFVPGAPPKPVAANFYPEGASKAELERWIQSLPEAERARATGFFTVIRRAGNTLHPGALQHRISGRARARRGAPARGGAAGDRADAQDVPHQARGRVSLERLLRQRRGLDGAEGCHRADHRPVRGLRGRAVQLQGRVRVVHHGAGRGRNREAPEARRRAAGHRKPPADRAEVPEPENRRAGANRRRQRDLRRRRRQPRRADRGLQPSRTTNAWCAKKARSA